MDVRRLLAYDLGLPNLCLAQPAGQPSVRNDGWVTDRAGLLSPGEESALEQDLGAYARRTGHEIALVIVPDLGGRPIEEVALGLGRAWAVGRKEQQDGVVLLVARAEKQVRIEVARGLEGVLTDSLCGRIIREVIVPRFKGGDFFAGLSSGVKAIQATIGGEDLPEELRARKEEIPWGLLILAAVVLLVMISRRRVSQGRRSSLGRTFGPIFFPGGLGSGPRSSGWGPGSFGGSGGGSSGGGFGGFGGGGGFSGGGASGRW